MVNSNSQTIIRIKKYLYIPNEDHYLYDNLKNYT